LLTRNHPRLSAKLAVAFLAVALLVACGREGVSEAGQTKRFHFEVVKSGIDGFAFIAKGKQLRVFRSKGEFDRFWRDSIKRSIFSEGGPKGLIDPAPSSNEMAPIISPVDFATQMVVAVFVEGSSRGDSVAIQSIRQEGDKVIVRAVRHQDIAVNFENSAPYQITIVDGTTALPFKLDITEK